MNSFLKLAVSTFKDDWESSGVGTIIRPILVLIDEDSNITYPWARWKYKQFCLQKPLANPILHDLDIVSRDREALAYAKELEAYLAETYHRLDHKVLMMYADMRAFLKGYLTEAQFRKENGFQTLLSFLRHLYLIQFRQTEQSGVDYTQENSYHLELDLRRKPRDRLAIVFAPHGAHHGK